VGESVKLEERVTVAVRVRDSEGEVLTEVVCTSVGVSEVDFDPVRSPVCERDSDTLGDGDLESLTD